jgi:hypothetical protein
MIKIKLEFAHIIIWVICGDSIAFKIVRKIEFVNQFFLDWSKFEFLRCFCTVIEHNNGSSTNTFSDPYCINSLISLEKKL